MTPSTSRVLLVWQTRAQGDTEEEEEEEGDREEGDFKVPLVFCVQVEHAGTRTYYFSAESHQEQEEWIKAMGDAAQVNAQPAQSSESIAPAAHTTTMVTKGPEAHQEQQQQHPIQTNTQTNTQHPIQTNTQHPIQTNTQHLIQTNTQHPIQTNTQHPIQTNTQGCDAHSDTALPPHPKVNGTDAAASPSPSTPHADREVRMSEGGRRGGGGRGEEDAEDDSRGPGPGSGPRTPCPRPVQQSNGWSHGGPPPPNGHAHPHATRPPAPRAHVNERRPPQGPREGGASQAPSLDPREQQENAVLRRGFVPRSDPERLAQRKSSMTQLQRWVNQRRVPLPYEDPNSPTHYYTVNRGVSADCYGVYGGTGPEYADDYPPLYSPGVRPDSICSVSGVGGGYDRRWTPEEKRRSLRDGSVAAHYGPHVSRDHWGPQYYGGGEAMDSVGASMKRLSIQPRSRSVPRSPSSSSAGPYSPGPHRFISPARSPSICLERVNAARLREDAIYADPAVYRLRRSLSSPKYDYPGDRRAVQQGLYYHNNYPASPSIHSRMGPPFHDVYSRDLHPTLKLNEIETSDSLEGALVATHQEMELYHNQPLVMDKLQYKKESLQNQLINIRGELSQASSSLTTLRMEFEALEDEANAIHGDLWEQLNAGGQSELVHRHIQKEFWRVQDVLEGLHKSNLSRGTDTSKHRAASGVSCSFSTTSPASPMSSVSLTSPLSPFSPVQASQPSPTKHLGPEPKYDNRTSTNEVQDQEDQERQSGMNKVGIVPPRTKSPTDDLESHQDVVHRRNRKTSNGLSRERPKSAVFPAEARSKMSVEEQMDRLRRNQSTSVREKRRSANGQPAGSYRVVRRRLTAHEVDIKDLEAAVRGEGLESPREEIARLRRFQINPDHCDLDIGRELNTPDKVLIPERYLDMEDSAPLSPEEQKEKQKKVERIKTLIAKSSPVHPEFPHLPYTTGPSLIFC
ncbi:hypothetical protein CRUP_010062 [Coryphaenoides rupestris]|nr:hypothetical protein CRUP_010062 [Coryphaenoides rupestris]